VLSPFQRMHLNWLIPVGDEKATIFFLLLLHNRIMAKKKDKVSRDPCVQLADGKSKCKQSWCTSDDCGYCKIHCNGDCKKKNAADAKQVRSVLHAIPPCVAGSSCSTKRPQCNSGSGHCTKHCMGANDVLKRRSKKQEE
jgi:hypothetical protein